MAAAPAPGKPLCLKGFGPTGKFWLTMPPNSVTYPPCNERLGLT